MSVLPEALEKLEALLAPRRADVAERVREATQLAERAREMQEGARRDLAALDAVRADPDRFFALLGEFKFALESRDALEAFLRAEDDNEMRNLVFTLRLAAELEASRRTRVGGT